MRSKLRDEVEYSQSSSSVLTGTKRKSRTDRQVGYRRG